MPQLAPNPSKGQRLDNVLSLLSLLLCAVVFAWWWGSYLWGPASPLWEVGDRQTVTLSFRGQIILLTQRRPHTTPEFYLPLTVKLLDDPAICGVLVTWEILNADPHGLSRDAIQAHLVADHYMISRLFPLPSLRNAGGFSHATVTLRPADGAPATTLTFLAMPYWVLALPVLVIPLTTLARRRRRRRRHPAGHCPTCGYNLRGNVSGVCPECGTAAA